GPPSGWGKTADFVISDNTIQIAGFEVNPAFAGIEAIFLDGAVISNNRILGSSTYGIALEGASKCLVKWNNVRRLAADVAAIYLDQDTNNCTVIGTDLSDTVMDQGTDNKLINVDVKPFRWLGQASHNSMKDKLELRKHHRPLWAR
ncbi:MAG TPA: right-handed parallel beta-helix repeat-containing protein, partial [Terriglobia bacterium]|nr:right-handed parallel beta-helix repeat-containing protein [Terriglobia bacterium]